MYKTALGTIPICHCILFTVCSPSKCSTHYRRTSPANGLRIINWYWELLVCGDVGFKEFCENQREQCEQKVRLDLGSKASRYLQKELNGFQAFEV